MNRNQNSHFALNPTNIDISRSKFDRSHSLKTSFNVGDLIPIFCDEVLPGDTFQLDTSMVVRMQPLVTPVMDNIYLDTYYFFVPNRLVWSHWQEFMGENTASAWIPQASYTIPQLTCPSGGWNVGTIADYFGLPTGNVGGYSVSALPFRAYALICNDWFRDENLQDPLVISVGDSTVTGVNSGTYTTDVAKGGLPFKACKYHDYFTSCLPAPQKGPDVQLLFAADQAKVYGVDKLPMGLQLTKNNNGILTNTFGLEGVYWFDAYQNGFGDTYYHNQLGYGSTYSGGAVSNDHSSTQSSGITSGDAINIASKELLASLTPSGVGPAPDSNVYADLTSMGTTINQLRLAFQIQRLYEKDARGGTRYIEILKSHFGVTSPDARLQRPEYLGGKRIPINVNQVVQTSETNSTPQGNTAAYSLTASTHSDFTKSFVEHGFVIGVAVARYDHTYQQGISRMWHRSDRLDYYWPVLANIGEQPVHTAEIYPVTSNGEIDWSPVWGYQEAWAEYRYKPNYVTSEMRSSYATSLDAWHLADDYNSRPYLSDSWIVEDKSNVDRCLAVSSAVSNQLFGDFYFKLKCTRPMPLYSIPGLIDHH